MNKWLKWPAVFILGFLCGASLTNIVIGSQLDHLHMSNKSLQQQLSVCERELQFLKESTEEKKKRVITGVELNIEYSGEEKLTGYEESSATLAIEKKVEEWLELIKGQELKELDYMLIPEIIDGREINVDGNQMVLKVNLVVIAETVIVHIKAAPVKKN